MTERISPFYVVRAQEIRTGFDRLRCEILDPWAEFNSGAPITITNTRGHGINYGGGDFERDAREVFWGGFLLDCVEDLIAEEIEKTKMSCIETDYFEPLALDETAKLLKSGSHAFVSRMAEIDRRLLSKGSAQTGPRRSIEPELTKLNHTIQIRTADAKQRLHISSPNWLARNAMRIAVGVVFTAAVGVIVIYL